MAELKRFNNRMQAGAFLSQRLRVFFQHPNAIVLALPRGGVQVGFSIAKILEIPLDVMLVRKLGVPGHEEYAMGAIANGGLCVLQHEVLEALEIPTSVVENMAQRALLEIDRQEKLYRSIRTGIPLRGRIVILVDDGMATGSSMLIAAKTLRKEMPARIILATPVAPPDVCEKLREEVDEIICLNTPDPFYAVGLWYENFEQITDAEVMRLLEESEREHTQHYR
ncbi:MAG TPA: phosphoribosyltransferase [Burkholderiaceae bacterium]